MHLVCFGQQNWAHCWTGKQQLMTRLARRGHRILYVDPDSEHDGTLRAHAATLALRATPNRLQRFMEGLHIYTPHRLPWMSGSTTARLHRLSLQAVCRRLKLTAPIAFALRPDRAWLMHTVRPSAMVYYAVDEWTAFRGMSETAQSHFRLCEEMLVQEADLAMGVSPRLVERFARLQPNTHKLENGSDFAHFSAERLSQAVPHPMLAPLHGPRIGFVGQVDERLDQDLLLRMAQSRPTWNIILAGRVKAGMNVAKLAGHPRIHLLGHQHYADLPGLLREVDVCTVPYVRSDLTQSCNPLKVLEYLATGKPVVARPLEGLGATRDVLHLAETDEQFIQQVDQALADPDAGRPQRIATAAANTWDARVDTLEHLLEDALRRGLARGRKYTALNWLKRRRARQDSLPSHVNVPSTVLAHGLAGVSRRLAPDQVADATHPADSLQLQRKVDEMSADRP